jgi:hypothetical protein
MRPDKAKPVLVTTEYRGVFFGYAEDTDGDRIKLHDAKCAIYWNTDVNGFLGLAAVGPNRGCRISRPATVELRKVTAVVEVTPEAVKAWEAA